MKEFKRKLCSRKLWLALIGFGVAVGSAFGLPEMDLQRVALIASGCASLSAYVLGEGMADGSRKDKDKE